MKFKARFGFIFFTQTTMVFIWLWLSYSRYNSSYAWHFDYLVCLLTAVLWFGLFHRSIVASLFNKAILTVDESCLYDFVSDVKYEWKDVEGIHEGGGVLRIKVYNPKDYLNKIGNFQRRFVNKLWFKPNGKHSIFTINMSLISGDARVIAEILKRYRIIALETQKPKNTN